MSNENSDQDQEQKTEEPSEKRLEDARQKGQAPISKEVMHWFFLLASMVVLTLIIPLQIQDFGLNLRFFFDFAHEIDIHSLDSVLFKSTLRPLWFPLIFLMIVILGIAFLQKKDSISLTSLAPKFNRISPSQGVKKIFSKQAITEFLKTVIKTIILFILIYYLIKDYEHMMKKWVFLSLNNTFKVGQSILWKFFIYLLIFSFFLAVLDYLYQRFEFFKNLRMTKEEVKREFKEQEGDPLIKQRIYRLRLQRIKTQMMQNVPKATVVITNPTHYAVALSFDEIIMAAPTVIAKGQDHIALQMIKIAKKHNIPIVENPPVARDLYSRVELNMSIPEDTYRVVSEIIRFVLKLKKQQF